MDRIHPVKQIVELRKKGIKRGIYSVCSANEYVVEAAMERALYFDTFVLIEATANQSNQFGGYTGMKPDDFKRFILGIAKRIGFPEDRLILGGDHLGPLVWKQESSRSAMEKACELVRQYVAAGFTKIHIDTSMKLGDDDKNACLDTRVIAERGALICKAAEKAYEALHASNTGAPSPVYVIGSEVPIPGGSVEVENEVSVTKAADFEETLNAFRQAFLRNGLERAWENVVAVVVQPGVEFGDDFVIEYDRYKAAELTGILKRYPDIMFEGHSTDYQNPESLKRMVEDGIGILKVGPALTFALREGLFALDMIEEELYGGLEGREPANFRGTLDREMDKNPGNWEKYYRSDDARKTELKKKYSYSDRCRYYLPAESVSKSVKKLLSDLANPEGLPLNVISQYMPAQYLKIRAGLLKNSPEALLKDKVGEILDDYCYATLPSTLRRI